jgi:hypothetical protein
MTHAESPGTWEAAMLRRIAIALCAIGLIAIANAEAAQAPAPSGPVILTVSGAIGKANRGPVDPFRDRLLNYHDITFDKAMAFTRADLVKLGMHAITVSYPEWPGPHRFEGPLLRDVLAQAGVASGSLHPLGLDGYSAEIPFADLNRYDVILALKMDGHWLGTGGLGPAWILYPYDDVPALHGQDDSKWVWGVFHIAVDPR